MKYPDLSDSKIISFDIEAYDPEIQKMGPGVYRKDGNVLGVAIANDDGFADYYNIGHPRTDRELRKKNLAFITDVLALPVKKVGVNILYDMDWLCNGLGVAINGDLHDVQIAEPLLNENQRNYSLEHLSLKYCRKEKQTTTIQQFCDRNGLKGDPRNYLYMMPVETVRDYAIVDAINPIEIFQKQWSLMETQKLTEIYEIEMALFPLLLRMRSHGVRISIPAIKHGIKELKKFLDRKYSEFVTIYGELNFNSPKQLGKLFDKLGIQYPLTEKGNPNLDSKVLAFKIDHPVAKQIVELREAHKILNTFFINSFLGHNVAGRIHCSFHPNKTEEYGTKSGRFSSSDPNLQQIPSRDETYGTICRQVFIPEEGHVWGKIDYSQIEYRLIAHYAVGDKSDFIREQYTSDPDTDYHQMIMDLTGLTRKRAKVLNFGMAYMMGAKTMNRQFGWPREECQDLIDLYNREVPFIKATRSWVTQVAKSRGYIRTIMNRRARVTPEMVKAHREYSMFNRLIQGSAADLLKKAMVDCYNAGIYDVLVPHLTVHDELDVSIPVTKEGAEAAREMKKLMEETMKLKVPVVADMEVGTDWGHVEECDFTLEQLEAIDL